VAGGAARPERAAGRGVGFRAAAGSAPGDERDAAARRVLRFEVAADTFALVREAIAHLSRLSGNRLDDDAALLAMTRAVLGGLADAGRASYQIGLSVCVRCGSGEQPAAGQVVRVEPEVVAMARCDADELGWVGAVSATRAGPSGDAGTREREPESECGGAVAHRRADETRPVAKPENSAHVGTRGRRSIPSAVRRRVLHRDHRCCSVPGCRNTLFVDLHHLVPRCEGGQHTAQGLITLCGVHHRAVHRGELVIAGTSVDEVRFLHADRTPYGGGLDAAAVDAQAKVFSALRNLGFREKDVRVVLGTLRADPTARQLEVGPLLRQALERLGPSARVQ